MCTAPIRILVDSFADQCFTNSQMRNAREIVRRLSPERFHVSMFCSGDPDYKIAGRANTRLIHLAPRRQTPRILKEFLLGKHDILFYLKASPAAKWYQRLRKMKKNRGITVATIESQSDLYNEPTVPRSVRELHEQAVLRCDYLFSNSQSVQRSLKSEYGLASEIVPTGVDTRFFSPLSNRPANQRPQVLFVGSLRPFKQPQTLLDAARLFSYADFVIVGAGAMGEQLKNSVKAEHLTNVVLTGAMQPEQLMDVYQQSDIFLFPSTCEGSPKVILEAAACGLPVIARRDYEPETVIDGKTGYLVGSNEDLLTRLASLLADPELCRNMGRAGRRLSEQFDWDLIAKRWEDIFLYLMSPRTKA